MNSLPANYALSNPLNIVLHRGISQAYLTCLPISAEIVLLVPHFRDPSAVVL